MGGPGVSVGRGLPRHGQAYCSRLWGEPLRRDQRVFLGSLEATLKVDPSWEGKHKGFFERRPTKALTAFASIYAGWGVGTDWYNAQRYRSAGFESADEFVLGSYVPGFANCDADDLLSQIRTWRDADVGRKSGGGGSEDSLAAALGKVRARVLLMPCDSDRYFTLSEAEREAALLGNVELSPIESSAGHRAGDPHRAELKKEAAFIRQKVHAHLATAVPGFS